MLTAIKNTAKQFLEKTENKPIQIISHHDTDGITSAAILIKALQRLKKKFSVRIVKQLEEKTIKEISEEGVVIFLDLASNSFNYLKNIKNPTFILDHHEITSEIPKNISIVNPYLFDKEEMSASAITYLFVKELNGGNKDLASLAVIGIIGDLMEKNIGKTGNLILNDSKIIIKKGLTLYPATRPIDKVLEYNSEIYIPGVTGSFYGTSNLLKDIGIEKIHGQYKSIIELDEQETSKLITTIALQNIVECDIHNLIGNIYLTNFFNKLEDVRQISATINACSRLGESGIAIAYCLQNKKAKEKVEKIYTAYKREIVSSLNSIPDLKKIEDKNYLIINAQDKIKDTLIGTIASILSNSREYEEGKAIIAMAYNEDKIKVSARMVGKSGKNIRELLNSVVEITGGEVGGHPAAAGCLIARSKEQEFLENLKSRLEIELIKL